MTKQYEMKGFVFTRKDDHRIVVAAEPHTDAMLEYLASLYQEQAKYTRSQFRGEWEWCGNPDCSNAIYVPQKHLRRGFGLTCSQNCARAIQDGRVQTQAAREAYRQKLEERGVFTIKRVGSWVRVWVSQPKVLFQAKSRLSSAYNVRGDDQGQTIFVDASNVKKLRQELREVGVVVKVL
jgi:hypothetical protein